jgi:hypothetical protein
MVETRAAASVSVETPEGPPVLLLLESLSDLVDIEHDAKAKLSPDSRSVVSQTALLVPRPGCLTLLYPQHSEQTFRDELRPLHRRRGRSVISRQT